MKGKYSYIGVALIILIFGIIFIPKIVSQIQNDDVVRNDRMSASAEVQANRGELSYVEVDGVPKKVPEFAFINQDSLYITNEDFKGKVFLVEFFFTRCPSICPIMNQNLVSIQNEFKGNDNLGFASFTIDPEHDTSLVLKKYAEKYGITNPNWHLMTGDKNRIYELSNTGFNIFAKENPNVTGGFEHSGFFALIDKKGFLRSRKDKYANPIIYYRGTVTEEQREYNGEKEQISILKEDIKKLLKE